MLSLKDKQGAQWGCGAMLPARVAGCGSSICCAQVMGEFQAFPPLLLGADRLSLAWRPRPVSGSKLRRDFARCWAHRRRLSKKMETPTSSTNLAEVFSVVLGTQDSQFVEYFRAWETGAKGSGGSTSKTSRQRDVFPLPPLRQWPLDAPEGQIETYILFANLCLAALNFLASDMRPANTETCRNGPTIAQQSVQQHVAGRCERFLQQFDEGVGQLSWQGSFQRFEGKLMAKYPRMHADAVDLPARAATCDPQELLPPDMASCILDAAQLFPAKPQSFSRPWRTEGAARDEYIKLTLRQLECGKTVLRQRCQAVGDVFCVPKSTPGKQREVWNGSLVSQAALQPPAPCKLANPSCFVDLLFKEGEEIFMSKRDVHTCFDVLKAPDKLQEWFGRPPVTLRELSRVSKVPLAKLRKYIADDPEHTVSRFTSLFPSSTVWPMGFSWSSCVAQACTVACCREAGVNEADFMSLDSPPPSGQEACGVATDDTFFFHKSKADGQERLRRLDAVLDDRGMPKNPAKDVSLAKSMTALGCQLSAQPPAAEPASSKLMPLFLALLDVFVAGEASPAGLGRALGVEQWFCLLSRPMYSVFDGVYEFVQREPRDKMQFIPHKVRTELIVSACLSPLLGADLGRDFLSKLIACDASGAYGFGVSYMPCSAHLVKKVSLLSERRGDFVRLFPEEGGSRTKDRVGVPHMLPFHQWQFRTAIRAKAKWKAHSGILEGHALLLALKWVLRSPGNFGRRLVILVDAKAILGAASKGRTSAPALRGVLRRIGSLLMATNSLLRLIYIPSEDNPADKPSRGKLNSIRKPWTKRQLASQRRLRTVGASY